MAAKSELNSRLQLEFADVFIVSAKRTAMGDFGKAFKDKSATDLAEIASRAAIKVWRCKSGALLNLQGIPADAIDSCIMGNVIQSSRDAAYIARHVALRVGLPVTTAALTLNRLCGSGFQSIVSGVHEIQLGESRLVLAGGTESMSQAPFAVRGTRFGVALGAKVDYEDTLWSGLTDEHIKMPMGNTAEKLGEQYKVTRADVDAFGMRSQVFAHSLAIHVNNYQKQAHNGLL